MNRKQRRAQGASNVTTAADIPMAKPPEHPEKPVKTLYEIAAERQAKLMPNAAPLDSSGTGNVVNVKIGPDGKIEPLDGGKLPPALQKQVSEAEEDEGDIVIPLLDTLMFSTSLSALHFTLTALTIHQYAEPEMLSFKKIFFNTLWTAFPILTLLIHIMHGNLVSLPGLSKSTINIFHWLRSAIWLVAANIAGCYLIHLTNDKGYMAVMKDAPAVGTVWVLCVIEMGLAGALAGVAGPGAFAWYYEYSVI